MKLLHLDSSITGENSVSRSVSAAIVAKLKEAHPDLEVTYRDLVAQPLEHLTLPALADTSYADAFLAADIVVIGAAMYNFTLSTQLKAWLDRILLAGKTFRYGAGGRPEGLAGGKRVIVALARGGFYGPGKPASFMEHAETYLRGVFGFIGITDPEFIVAEGIATGPEQRQVAHAGALDAASKVTPLKITA